MEDSSISRFFNRQLEVWTDARHRFRDLKHVETRQFSDQLKLQWNPARIVSTGAKIDKKTLGERPCFLCDKNRPKEQMSKQIDEKFHLLVNPFPILPVHFTIPARKHQPRAHLQELRRDAPLHQSAQRPDGVLQRSEVWCIGSRPSSFPGRNQRHPSSSDQLAASLPQPDRHHLLNDEEKISVVRDFIVPAFVIISKSAESDEALFRRLYKAMPQRGDETEPMMNIISWRKGEEFISVVIPREKHRPEAYFAEGDAQFVVSPGALDMSGLIITPREEDFRKLTEEKALSLLQECGVSEEKMNTIIAN